MPAFAAEKEEEEVSVFPVIRIPITVSLSLNVPSRSVNLEMDFRIIATAGFTDGVVGFGVAVVTGVVANSVPPGVVGSPVRVFGTVRGLVADTAAAGYMKREAYIRKEKRL